MDVDKLEAALMEVMDLRPRGIREHLDLNKAIYARTAAYGHFGREPDGRGRLLLGEDGPRLEPARGARLNQARP